MKKQKEDFRIQARLSEKQFKKLEKFCWTESISIYKFVKDTIIERLDRIND